MKKIQKICFVFLLTVFSSVYAGDCFKDGDVDDCFTKAEQGVVEAYNELGTIYYAGRGVEQNYLDAFYFWERAAEEGIAASQLNLGHMYYVGEGVAQSNQEALKWFKKAAEQGDAFAEEQVKVIEEKIVRDTENEFVGSVKTAEQGDAFAEEQVKVIEEKIVRDTENEFVGSVKTAEQGDAFAEEQVKVVEGQLARDKELESVMCDDDFNCLTKGSREYNEKLFWFYYDKAEQGDAASQLNLGHMYDVGEFVAQSNQEALKWFKKAAEQGNSEAQFKLGSVAQSNQEALKWFKKAAEQGDAFAEEQVKVIEEKIARDTEEEKIAKILEREGSAHEQYNLGVMYYKGQGVPQDYQAAVKWYRLAAEQGFAKAQYYLAWMYYEGQGVPQDYQAAVKWFKKAAEQGYASAQYDLGVMYGGNIYPNTPFLRTLADQEQSVIWYIKAAQGGHARALNMLSNGALKLSTFSASTFDADISYVLGNIYKKIDNDRAAVKWYRNAAEQGHSDAQFLAGTLLGSGKEAMRWYELAAKQGHSGAIKRIGIMKEESAASAERKSERKFQGELNRILALAVVMSFIGMLLVGMNNKIVIYFDKRDFYISLMPWVSLVIGFAISSMIEMPLIRNSFSVISTIAAVSFFGWSVRLSVFYNQSTPVGVFVGIFKVLCSALGVVLLVGTIQNMFSRDSGVKDFIVGTILLGVFIWIGKKLINGEQVYLSKGWDLPETEDA